MAILDTVSGCTCQIYSTIAHGIKLTISMTVGLTSFSLISCCDTSTAERKQKLSVTTYQLIKNLSLSFPYTVGLTFFRHKNENFSCLSCLL
jgi:hypothetical protein